MNRNIISSALLAVTIFGMVAMADIDRGLTQDFKDWLTANNYADQKFDRSDMGIGGAYGGKASSTDVIKNVPIIFFHGNSDIAVGQPSSGGWQTGFTKSIEYFISQGYTKAELYITTWGPGDQYQSYKNTHSQEYLTYLRKFTEAVLAYTGASKVAIISHSMGVTLGRRVIKGGVVTIGSTSFDLGVSLAGKVDTFIGIAGANLGLVNCQYMSSMFPTCNTDNGFYPGSSAAEGPGKYLAALNADATKEGDHVYAMFSIFDDLIMFGDLVFGSFTSKFPTIDDFKMYEDPMMGHIALRDNTKEEQYSLVTKHAFTSSEKQEFLQ